jgi:hypothetical protein
MSPEAQRIAIAKSVGIHLHDGDHAPSNYVFVTNLPDYLNDLNAMHEAWQTLTPSQKTEFESELYLVIMGQAEYHRNDDAPYITNATASQRAEAFLRTIGKWEGENKR